MFVVDTNILIYAASRQFNQHQKARALLESWIEEAVVWHSTWSVFYEFLRVSTHPHVFSEPLSAEQAWSFLDAILASPGFSLLSHSDNHSVTLSKLIDSTQNLSGNIWHDAHIVAVMFDYGIKEIYSADTDFHRFKGIKVVDPF